MTSFHYEHIFKYHSCYDIFDSQRALSNHISFSTYCRDVNESDQFNEYHQNQKTTKQDITQEQIEENITNTSETNSIQNDISSYSD